MQKVLRMVDETVVKRTFDDADGEGDEGEGDATLKS